MQPGNTIQIKPYSIVELANIYGVCDKTLKKWIKPFEQEIGDRQGRFYTVFQVKIIMDKIGLPFIRQIA